MSKDPPGRGWFSIPGVLKGERTLKQQLGTLHALQGEARGKSLLDIGCAEGLIADWLDAAPVHGVEIVAGRLDTARRIFAGRDAKFWCADLDYFDLFAEAHAAELLPRYHTVLALSILQKMRRPAALLASIAGRCETWLAIRLPSPVIQDVRSNNAAFDVKAALAPEFNLDREGTGGASEWVGVFKRRA